MVRDTLWPAKLTAMTVYYALHYHKEQTGAYTDRLDYLIVPRDIVDPFVVVIELVDDDADGVGGLRVTVVMHQDDNDDKTETMVSVCDDGAIQGKIAAGSRMIVAVQVLMSTFGNRVSGGA